MTTIRATCPTCGDVGGIETDDLTVRVCTEDLSGSYVFRCPVCGLVVTKEASSRIVDLLVGAGCPLVAWSFPAELRDPDRAGPPLSLDDLLDLHEALEALT